MTIECGPCRSRRKRSPGQQSDTVTVPFGGGENGDKVPSVQDVQGGNNEGSPAVRPK